MKICDVVLNSVWYDPRVRKQLISYIASGADTVCVGYRCDRYDKAKIEALPCKTTIIDVGEKYRRRLKNPLEKVRRLRHKNRILFQAILAERPEVIHANDLSVLVSAYRASKKLKCVLVYDSHEINVENYRAGEMPAVVKRIIAAAERHIMKRTSINICTNHAAADYFANKYHIQPPMVVTNCALASEICSAGEKHPGFEVLNHGRFYDGRGYDLMIEAAPLLANLPDVKLALRGYGTIEQKLRDRCSELDAKNVVFYPPVRVEELIGSATSSHVGVAITEPICLNFKYSVSNKLFEYAAAGLPVIMSDIPEHRYLNEKYHFGVIIPKNTPEAFADAVRTISQDPELYSSCSENARKMSSELNWDTEFQKLIEAEKTIQKKKSK